MAAGRPAAAGAHLAVYTAGGVAVGHPDACLFFENDMTSDSSPWVVFFFFHFCCLHPDVESDWSPIHDAAFNGRVLALRRLIGEVRLIWS